MQRSRTAKVAVGIRNPYIRVVGFEIDTEGPGRSSGVPITQAEEEEFRRLSANPNVYELMAKSIAPSIYGSIGKFKPNNFEKKCITGTVVKIGIL